LEVIAGDAEEGSEVMALPVSGTNDEIGFAECVEFFVDIVRKAGGAPVEAFEQVRPGEVDNERTLDAIDIGGEAPVLQDDDVRFLFADEPGELRADETRRANFIGNGVLARG
jgi:hypothetical protein